MLPPNLRHKSSLVSKSLFSFLRTNIKFFKHSFSKESLSIKEARSVVTPYVNLDHISDDDYIKSLSKRGFNENIIELKQLWNSYNNLLHNKSVIEEKRENNRLLLLKNKENKSTDSDELKTVGKLLRDEFKNINNQITSLENILIPKILNLPNSVDPKVRSNEVLARTHLNPCKNEYNHVETGSQLGLLEYVDPYLYYFKDIAAKYELEMCQHVTKLFCHKNFISMSNTDFSRIHLVEGWINNSMDKHLLTLAKSLHTEPNNLFLNGGAHFLSSCAILVNSIIESDSLPLKYVSQGRIYLPFKKNLNNDLYNVVQNSSVNFFIGCDKENLNKELEKVTDIIWNFYKTLNIPLKLVYSPIANMLDCESLRLSFQIFSPFYNKYVEVGYVSKTDDYVSKRLRMYYKDEEHQFLNIIYGNVVKVPVVVGCLLENAPESSVNLLKEHLNLFKIK